MTLNYKHNVKNRGPCPGKLTCRFINVINRSVIVNFIFLLADSLYLVITIQRPPDCQYCKDRYILHSLRFILIDYQLVNESQREWFQHMLIAIFNFIRPSLTIRTVS